MDSKNLLNGIIPPMVTPLSGQNELDIPGLERLVEHIIDGGVHGLFILGTTGEAPDLSYEVRYNLVKHVCKQVNKRVPVFVGITDTAFSESVKLANYASEHGADAVVVAPPYYLSVAQPELIEYMEHLAGQLPLPIVLYNMPGCTKVMIGIQTVREIAEIPGVIGIKDSSGDVFYFHKLKRMLLDRPDFHILIGPEEMLAETVLLGANGGVCGGANLFPKLYVDLYNAAAAGDIERVKKLHRIVIEISSTIYSVGQHSSSIIKGIKCGLSLMGICDDFLAEPFHRFRDPQRKVICGHLERIIDMYNKACGTSAKLAIADCCCKENSVKREKVLAV